MTRNTFNLPEPLILDVFEQLSPQVFGSVQDTLPSFPLPQFAGLDLSLVEIGGSAGLRPVRRPGARGLTVRMPRRTGRRGRPVLRRSVVGWRV